LGRPELVARDLQTFFAALPRQEPAMNDASTLRIAAIFFFLSALAIFAGVPFAAGLGGVGGPGPIDFGDGERLLRLAELGAAPVRVDLFALLGPLFVLPAGMGLYALLRSTSRLAQLGVAMWYVGMLFIVIQEALQLAFVSTLPGAYAAADPATRAALEAVGGSLGYAIEVLAISGHLPYDLGSILLSLLMWRCPAVPKWIAGLGLAAATLASASGVLSLAFPEVAWLSIGRPIGIFALIGWGVALGVVMLREARQQSASSRSAVRAGV
ncbi:MAG: DUF4386 family protein, partial [Steroidobacteraceae bacterium]